MTTFPLDGSLLKLESKRDQALLKLLISKEKIPGTLRFGEHRNWESVAFVFLIQCVDEAELINTPKILIGVNGPFHDNKV